MSDNIYSCPDCGSEGDKGDSKEVPHTYGTEFDTEYTCIECKTKWTVRSGFESHRLETE